MLWTHVRSDGHSFVRSDNVKTVYPPTKTVCGGYNKGADQPAHVNRSAG